MSGPFKLKYKNSAFPFKTDKKTLAEIEQRKIEKERSRSIDRAIRRGDAPPVTEERLQDYLDAIRTEPDKFV